LGSTGRMSMRDDYLFTKQDLHHFLENHKQRVKAKIDELDQNYLLKANEDELKEYFLSEYGIEAPRLLEESIYVDEPTETEIDVTGDPMYDWGRPLRCGRLMVKGTRVVIHVPFEGESEFFKWQPNRYTFNPPRARISGSELLLVYDVRSSDSENLDQRWRRDVASIREYLQTVRSQVEQCLQELPGIINSAISARKTRLQQSMGVVGALGLPVRRSGNEIVSVALPKKRRPTPTPLPAVPPGQYQAEPAIDTVEYEHILQVISSLTVAIERSPSAFAHMGEEQLRDLLLIQLNGHYEGSATGETFNGSGKTDILVRVKDKNVFIGECKFWKGQKAFLETIDQLFGYSCWSDTKTTIVLFNRNRDHTKVLQTIREQISNHPKFKKELQHKAENHLRYLFEHPEDPDRRIYVAVLAINLPSQ